MKWKTRKYKPEEGDIRCKRKFAFLPTTTIDDYTVWLETYDSVQEYRWSAGDVGFTWEEIRRLPLYAY